MDTYQKIDEEITKTKLKLAEYHYASWDLISEVWELLTKHKEEAERLQVPVSQEWFIDRALYLLQKSRVFLSPSNHGKSVSR